MQTLAVNAKDYIVFFSQSQVHCPIMSVQFPGSKRTCLTGCFPFKISKCSIYYYHNVDLWSFSSDQRFYRCFSACSPQAAHRRGKVCWYSAKVGFWKDSEETPQGDVNNEVCVCVCLNNVVWLFLTTGILSVSSEFSVFSITVAKQYVKIADINCLQYGTTLSVQ